MAFGTLKADTLTHSTAGSVDTNYVVNGSTKVWATWDSANDPATLEDSFNTSTLTDVEQGVFKVNINNSMSNAYYSAVGMIRFYHMSVQTTLPTTSVLSVRTFYVSNTSGARSSYDNAYMTAQIVGELA